VEKGQQFNDPGQKERASFRCKRVKEEIIQAQKFPHDNIYRNRGSLNYFQILVKEDTALADKSSLKA
jgi:hypothetical protein